MKKILLIMLVWASILLAQDVRVVPGATYSTVLGSSITYTGLVTNMASLSGYSSLVVSVYSGHAVGVDGIVAEVTYVSEDGAYFHSGSTFTISNGVVNGEFTLSEDWLIEVGSTVSLDDLGGFYDDVAAVLTNVEEEFDLSMVGTSSKAGITATVRIDIESTITGNPL